MSENDRADAATESVGALARELALELPPASRIVGIEREGRGEALLRVKLLMTAAEWAQFLVHCPVKLDAMEPGTGGFLGPDRAFWDPHAARNLRTGQVARSPGQYLNVGFDDADPAQIAVYIVQHGT